MQKLWKNKKTKDVSQKNPFQLKINFKEKSIVFLLFISASLAIFFSIAIIYTLVDGAIPFFQEISIFEFLSGWVWAPGLEKYGVLILVAATFIIAGLALLIGAPLGIAAAIYLSEFASEKTRSIVKPIIELLAGIPSIVFAFFALLVISPIFVENIGASYFNGLSAIVVIAIMIIPIVISISDDAMKAVPNHLRETSLAVGATKWETATKIVMPAASSGIMASVLLALARGVGETMVVLLVAGGIPGVNPLGPQLTMSGYVARVATGDMPPGTPFNAAFAVGILLFILAYGINSIGARIVNRIKTGSSVKSIKKQKSQNIIFRIITKLSIIFLSIFLRIGSFLKSSINKIKYGIRKDKILTLKQRYRKEIVGKTIIFSSILVAAVFLIVLLWSVFADGLSSINLTFLTSYPSRFPEKAGIFPCIMGTVYLMGLTIVFSAPIGIGAAIYLNEFAQDKWHTRLLRRIIQNLAGVPSIVFGLLGYFFFAHILGFGLSILSGSLVLTIMILPLIVVATEESLKSVPDSFREGARGVGSTRWQTVRHHVLPYAIPGILTGLILSISRAIGETAPILFLVSFFSKTAPSGIMDGFTALPSQILYWSQHANPEFHKLAAATIIVLLLILMSMNAVAIIIRQRAQAKRDW
jgi:phosphate ABC transporter permease subunit PstA/phosphate ABC transporter permease protein PstC